MESARLDVAAEAIWDKVMCGEERALEVWLKNRAAYRELDDLDLQRPAEPSEHDIVVYTGLPNPPVS